MYAVLVLCDADACGLAGGIRKEWRLEDCLRLYALFGDGAANE